jgi:putative redox protein
MEKINKWVSAVVRNDPYKTEITTDTHSLIGDEPLDNGGKDLGPSPGDFLRMSLASCTAITLRMYANRKGFLINRIEVKVFTETIDGKTVFNRSLKFNGELTEQQRHRMLQIANACPIHKILTNPIEVVTALV